METSFPRTQSSKSFAMLVLIGSMILLGLSMKFLPEMLSHSTGLSSPSNELQYVYDLEIDNMLTNVVLDPAYSHALEEHPLDAPIVQQCFAQKGAYMQFQIEPKKRYLRVCIVDEAKGLIGFQIVDIVNRVAKERTAYIKDKITCIRELLDYVRRMGYPRFTGPL